MSRTGQQRLDAILPAITAREEFKLRVDAAEGNLLAIADLMSEAIAMRIESNPLEPVGRNGKKTVCMENVMADHCMIFARDSYLRAKSDAVGKAA